MPPACWRPRSFISANSPSAKPRTICGRRVSRYGRSNSMADSSGRVLDQLFETLKGRRGTDPEKSYTAKLFARGRGKIAQKLGEEAVETVIAALSETPDRVVGESADLLYHLLVLWAECDIEPYQVWNELENRIGTSGIEEKKSRK